MGKFKLMIPLMAIVIMLLMTSCSMNSKEYVDLNKITLDNIEKVQIGGLKVQNKLLTKDEISELVKILNNSGKNKEEAKALTPKGGPPSLNIYLKSNKVITLFVYNNDNILVLSNDKKYIITQPDYNKFIASIFDKYKQQK